MDINIKLHSGQILRGVINSPGENARAMIIFVHGLGEHIQRYNRWIELFAGAGIGFTGVDLPGHGRSDGRRGHIVSYSLLDEMLDILITGCRNTFPNIPVFIYGHSLGGGVVLDYLLRRHPEVNGAIVTSPWIRLSFEPDRIKMFFARILKNILPGLVQPSGLVVNHISHDKSVVDKYVNDPLVHSRISVSLFYEAFSAGKYSLKHASELRVPVLIIHGSDDLITSPESSQEFAEKTKLAELKIWEGAYHELHNELFYQDVFAFILNWINTKILLNK
jgi:alpha-beta hydrolase superfamily lysophospholipase